MEKKVEKWVTSSLKQLDSRPRALLVSGSLGSGKSSLCATTAIKFCTAPFQKKVVYVASSFGRHELTHSLESRHIPLTADFALESVTSVALRVLRSDLALGQGRPNFDNIKVLFSRSEICAFLASCIQKLPISRFRPALDPTAYVSKIADFVEVLNKCDITPRSYDEWISREASTQSEIAYNLEIHRDLCSIFSDIRDIAASRNVITVTECVSAATNVLSQAANDCISRDAVSKGIWDFPCDLLILDDLHLYSPNQVRFIAKLAEHASKTTMITYDEDLCSIDRNKPLHHCKNSVGYFESSIKLKGLTEKIDFPCKQSRFVLTGEKIQVESKESEIDSIVNWITTRPPSEEPVYIATISEADRDEIVAILQSRFQGVYDVQHVGLKRKSFFEFEEVRSLFFFLNAVYRGPRDNADRDLYYTLTSSFFPYSPESDEISMLGDMRTRQQLSIRAALEKLRCGKALLSDLSVAGAAAASGLTLSQVAQKVLEITGLLQKLQNSISEKAIISGNRIAEFLQLIVKIEQRLTGRDTAGAIPVEVLMHLDKLHQYGGFHGIEDDLSSHYREAFSIREPDMAHGAKFQQVYVGTITWLCNEYAPASLSHLLLARATDDRLPFNSRRTGLTLPWPLLQSGQEEGQPFLDEIMSGGDRARQLEIQRRLCESLRARSKKNTLFYSIESGRNPSPFMLNTSQIQQEKSTTAKSSSSKTAASRPKVPNVRHLSSQTAAFEDDVITLSYSRMYEYETCPKRYYYSRVLGLQAPSNPKMVYGKALHSAVEEHYRERQTSLKLAAAQEAFARTFEREVFQASPTPEGFESADHLKEIRTLGKKVISDFHNRWEGNLARQASEILSIERRIELFWEEAKVKFVGVIDLVERSNDDKIRIIDFKSNVHDHAKLRRLGKDNAQLAIYAWAFEEEFNLVPDIVAIESLETGERYEVAASCTGPIRERLADTAHRIRRKEFGATPGYAACVFCPFNRICSDVRLR